MRAITLRPGTPDSAALEELPEPAPDEGAILVDGVALGVALGLLGVLMEPTTIVAKAWEQIDRVLARATIGPERVLVTGAGPIGLLAALLARQRGYDVPVLDRATDGPKPALARDLGATYEAAAEALAQAGRGWLERLITRRVPLERWSEALARRPDDIKVVVELS